jgi:hypothetical protein
LRRSNPMLQRKERMDCFASLAMTLRELRFVQMRLR